MIGRGLIAGAMMAALAGSLAMEPPHLRHPSVSPKRRALPKPTKATKRNSKRKKANRPLFRV